MYNLSSSDFAYRVLKSEQETWLLQFCQAYSSIKLSNLTFTTLLANAADYKLVTFFLFFPENRIWHFMQIVSIGDNLHEMLNPVFWEKYFRMWSADNFTKYKALRQLIRELSGSVKKKNKKKKKNKNQLYTRHFH